MITDLLMALLDSPVMSAAIPPTLAIAIVTATISVMVLAHRLSFLTVGVSHSTLAGLGMAVLLGLPLLPAATLFAIAIALFLGMMPERRGIHEDASTGILFAGSMALGIILLSLAGTRQVDLFGLLFGDILTIGPAERSWLWGLGLLILIIAFLSFRSWWSLAFDPISAAAGGMPASALRLLLYGTIGLTTILCVKLAGIVLTAGFMILPASCAWFWCRSLLRLWLISTATAILGAMLGLVLSYACDWPTGPAIVLVLSGTFILSWGLAWLKQRVRRVN